jgi:sarcosine oxidase
VFNLLVEEGRFYGFPVYGVPGLKFGKYHHLQETTDHEAHQQNGRPRSFPRVSNIRPFW